MPRKAKGAEDGGNPDEPGPEDEAPPDPEPQPEPEPDPEAEPGPPTPAGSRPLPRSLLLRPLPRRLPPIEREVELKADPEGIPIREDRGGRPGRRGRRRGRGGREPRPKAPEAAPPGAVASPEPSFGPPTAPPAPPREGGERRGRRRRRGRGRDRDRDARPPGTAPTPPPAPPPEFRPAPVPFPVPPAAVPPPAPLVGPDLRRWMESAWREAVAKAPERKTSLRKPPLAVPTADLLRGFEANVGWPGSFPFTRGIQPTMHRGRLWTMRQYAGFASAAETNRRFRYLLEKGQTGLSIAFDLPTQIGYDSDDPRSEGEVGKVGVPVNSLKDMETVLEGIPLDRVTVSMTINATAPILVAMVAATAKRRGIPLDRVGGTVQNDLLKEFVARNTWRFPVDASLRLTTDLVRFCVDQMPRWNPISVSGYHMREAGCTASQEVAFTLGHGLAYLERFVKAGVPVEKVAPAMSFFFAAQMDLLEEVAKFRAARRLWARLVRERFGGSDAACRLRFHTQTAGVALTGSQTEVNAVRVALQALAAVLGGTQSLHTNSRDEALGLPTEESVLLALRTQQVIAEESGVADVVDPLGGAPFVEAETDRIEEEARAILREMDAVGGPVEAARKGWTQARIAEAAWRSQKSIESGETVVVGVNRYAEGTAAPPAPVLRVDEGAKEAVLRDLRDRREARSTGRLDEALFALELAAGWDAGASGPGLMPAILRAVEAEATVGEICRSLEKAFGTFDPSRP